MATTNRRSLPRFLVASIIFYLLFITVVSAQQLSNKNFNAIARQRRLNKNAIGNAIAKLRRLNKPVNGNAIAKPVTGLNKIVSARQTRLSNNMALPAGKTGIGGARKNAKFVSDFLYSHNSERLRIGHQPLKWNYTLAYFAKQWAFKRVNDCKLIHSYGPYGENLFWGGRTHWSPRAVVQSWIDEKVFYDPNSNTCAKGEMCGHYTQVIWRDTTQVGCARIKCSNAQGLYMICSYDPPGNYVNETPFGGIVNPVAE